MPSVAERLKQVTLKVERAKKHILDLQGQVQAFLHGNPQPYLVGPKRDPETRRLHYCLTRVEPTPICLPLVAGDAVQNMMSALDHLAYQIVCSDTGDNPPNPNWIYFPIQDTADKYEAKKHGKMEGASKETFEAIDTLRPYKGGNDELWALYRLNNIEKHRLLITVGSMYHSMNIAAAIIPEFEKAIATDPKMAPFKGTTFDTFLNTFFSPSDVLFPLKVGDIVFTDLPDAEFNENLQFRFNVALYEPEIVKAQSILETLHQLTALVEGIVSALTPRLRDTG